jgi:hypothetical protein
MASVAEKNQLGAMLTGLGDGLGNAPTNPQLGHARRSGETRFHDGVSDFSRGAPIEKVGQHGMVDGDSA